MTIQVVIFDWGDTVMRVFPECEGPMATWPRVEAVPGIETALGTLAPRCRLALATNAADSGETLVRAALRRAGLERYFDAVLTARELGARKPEPAFFERVLAALTCLPAGAVMVGDDYRADVVGARRAGLRTVWFNPAAAACPIGRPAHDAEVQAMAELPAALDRMGL